MNPTETEITEALDACVELMVKIQTIIDKAEDEDVSRLLKIHGGIFDAYQELGRL